MSERAASSPRLALALTMLGLSACVSVPETGPSPALQTAQTMAAGQTFAPRGADLWPPDRWWERAGDPQLTELIDEGLANSPQVALAAARIRRAEAEARRIDASRLPSLGAEATGGLFRQSGSFGIPAQFLPDGWIDYGQVAINAGYDFDLWGRNRAALAAATSELRAVTVDAAQARLVLSVAITAAYAELGRAHRERDIAAAMLVNRSTVRELVAERERNALDNRATLRLAEAEVARADQALEAAEEAILIRRNQLAALVGAGPDRGLTITRPPLSPSTPVTVPDGLTTDLLGRRPDIVAARERVEAAGARIEQARAGFYPSINLRALIGLQALGLGNLVDARSAFGTVGPAISLPLFDGGARKAQYRGTTAAYDEAVAGYNQTVITAYQQAADALTQRDAADKRLGAARRALAASEDAFARVRERYGAGLVSRLDVLASERAVLELRLAVIALETNERGATLATIRALGGGFDARETPPAGRADR